MTASDARDRLAIKPDPAKSAEACRALIRAFLDDKARAGRKTTADALALAVQAFGLPPDFIETEGGQWH